MENTQELPEKLPWLREQSGFIGASALRRMFRYLTLIVEMIVEEIMNVSPETWALTPDVWFTNFPMEPQILRLSWAPGFADNNWTTEDTWSSTVLAFKCRHVLVEWVIQLCLEIILTPQIWLILLYPVYIISLPSHESPNPTHTQIRVHYACGKAHLLIRQISLPAQAYFITFFLLKMEIKVDHYFKVFPWVS